MVPQIECHYFGFHGKAVPIRLALYNSGIPFKDVIYNLTASDWKESSPMGQLPYLIVDGKCLSQSSAIYAYIATLTDLEFKDPFLDAKVLELYGYMDDIIQQFIRATSLPKDQIKRRVAYLTTSVAPVMLRRFDRLVSLTGQDGYAVGNRLSMADFCMVALVEFFKSEMLEGMDAKVIDPCFYVLNSYEKVMALPKVKEWLQKQQNK